MNAKLFIPSVALLALGGCGNDQQAQSTRQPIAVRGSEQQRMHKLGAFDLGIALKHAIYDAGYTCKRVTDGGFVGTYKNLDMWMAHCVYDKGEPRDWAVFAGPDGSAQVRDCRDIPGSGLPECAVKKRPAGQFTDMPSGAAKKAQ
jgi:hypothetical protein